MVQINNRVNSFASGTFVSMYYSGMDTNVSAVTGSQKIRFLMYITSRAVEPVEMHQITSLPYVRPVIRDTIREQLFCQRRSIGE